MDLVRDYYGIYNFFGKTIHNHFKKYKQNDLLQNSLRPCSFLSKQLMSMDVSYFAAQQVFWAWNSKMKISLIIRCKCKIKYHA